MVNFNSKKDWKAGAFIWGAIVALMLIMLQTIRTEPPANIVELLAGLLLLLLPVGLLLWIWFDTGYTIQEGNVAYRSGPFRGKVPIQNINQIVKKSNPLVGLKPVLSTDCVKVIYKRKSSKKDREIYFSPVDKAVFINHIRKANPNVKII